jgi:hypothetical protein
MAERIDVYNLSNKIPVQQGFDDGIQDSICNLQTLAVFVAAAGNDGDNLGPGCTTYPACWDYPNVISVVALTLDSDSPKPYGQPDNGSNYGPNLDVAAPGEAVMSAIRENRWARSSGTSQAAPVVSAAAALLYSKERRMLPGEVKERLIVTSDLFDSLRGKVLGGRLNIRRALDLSVDQVVYADPAGEVHRARGRASYERLYFRRFDATERDSVPWSRVLRMHRDERGQTYTLFLRSSGWSTTARRSCSSPPRSSTTPRAIAAIPSPRG